MPGDTTRVAKTSDYIFILSGIRYFVCITIGPVLVFCLERTR